MYIGPFKETKQNICLTVHRPFGHASEEWRGQTGSGDLSKEGHYRDATSAKRSPHKGYISGLGQGSELTTTMVWKLHLPLTTGRGAVAVLLTGLSHHRGVLLPTPGPLLKSS